MYTSRGHLTYCTNIHPGETWEDHFTMLAQYIPDVKEKLSPVEPFGIGLRLSNVASISLSERENMALFRRWLAKNDCYVFTINGFPYGGFHHTIVKAQVHAPDWLSPERVDYTIRLASLLSELLPDETDGGISTSPLTYRFWHADKQTDDVFRTATLNLMQVVVHLVEIKQATGKLIHVDLEPEPDGLLGNGKEFLEWFLKYLLPLGIPFLQNRFDYIDDVAESVIKEHVQLCYDICHFAVGYEDHVSMIQHTRALGIKIGKIQISAALKARMPAGPEDRSPIVEAFRTLNEPIYLHQVVAKRADHSLVHYADMPQALVAANDPSVVEWRAHYHVPLFIENYGLLHSTRRDIEKVLEVQNNQPVTSQLEVETYTWEVLPEEMRLPLAESIIKEMEWVASLIKGTHPHHSHDKAYD